MVKPVVLKTRKLAVQASALHGAAAATATEPAVEPNALLTGFCEWEF